ncbi:MAG: 50S ribosomal protein L24 [Chitinophagales bacterium]
MGKSRFTPKFKIKKGDTVKVIAGNDKGKTGVVKEIISEKLRVIVEGVGMISKHQKPDAKNPEGGIIKMEAPIAISNIMLVDPKSGDATRVGIKREGNKVQRISKKSGEVI